MLVLGAAAAGQRPRGPTPQAGEYRYGDGCSGCRGARGMSTCARTTAATPSCCTAKVIPLPGANKVRYRPVPLHYSSSSSSARFNMAKGGALAS